MVFISSNNPVPGKHTVRHLFGDYCRWVFNYFRHISITTCPLRVGRFPVGFLRYITQYVYIYIYYIFPLIVGCKFFSYFDAEIPCEGWLKTTILSSETLSSYNVLRSNGFYTIEPVRPSC